MSVLDDLRGTLWDVMFAERHLSQEEATILIQALMEAQDALAEEKRKSNAR